MTAGGFHVPLRIEGSFSFGQYMRIIAMKSPFGAGTLSEFVTVRRLTCPQRYEP